MIMKKVKKMKEMKVRKNYRNVWLEDERMEQQFPELVKHFSYGGKGWAEDDETILNLYGLEFKKEKHVSFYSTSQDVAKIINRCAKAILKMRIITNNDGSISGVEFIISKSAFRNPMNAFNTKYVPDTLYETLDPNDKKFGRMIDSERIKKMQEGRKNGKTETQT